jgi:hypothetical protein
MSMNESEALEFFDDVVGDSKSSSSEEYVLESDNGRELNVEVVELDRSYVIDQLNELPDEMLEQMTEIEDEGDIDEQQAAQAAGGISGDAIRAFEELCAEGMEHPELTTHQLQMLAQELGLEVLFEVGSIIIEQSLEEDGRITGFRKAN